MLKGTFMTDKCWFLILDLLEEREGEILEDTGNEFKLCSLCIKNILACLPKGSSDSVGVILPIEGWYYILDLIDSRIWEIEDEEGYKGEVWMLEACRASIYEGLEADEPPFPEV